MAQQNILSVFPPKLSFQIPEEFLSNEQLEDFGQIGSFEIVNNTNQHVTWKLKTNRKGRYRFNPILGCLEKRGTCQVLVSLAEKLTPIAFKKADKFRFQGIKEDTTNLDESEVKKQWQTFERQRKDEMHILTIDCHLHLQKLNATAKTVGKKNAEIINDISLPAPPKIKESEINSTPNPKQNSNENTKQLNDLKKLVQSLKTQLEQTGNELGSERQKSKKLADRLRENLTNLQKANQRQQISKTQTQSTSPFGLLQIILIFVVGIAAYYFGTMS